MKELWNKYGLQIFIGIVLLVFILGLFIGYKNGNIITNKQDIEKVKLEERIEQNQRELVRQLVVSDSLRKNYIKVSIIIDSLKKKQPIIVKYYEKIIGHAITLPIDD